MKKEQYVIKFNTGQYLKNISPDYSTLDTCEKLVDSCKSVEYEMKNISNFLNNSGYKCKVERMGK
jgi:hypothetical protein